MQTTVPPASPSTMTSYHRWCHQYDLHLHYCPMNLVRYNVRLGGDKGGTPTLTTTCPISSSCLSSLPFRCKAKPECQPILCGHSCHVHPYVHHRSPSGGCGRMYKCHTPPHYQEAFYCQPANNLGTGSHTPYLTPLS